MVSKSGVIQQLGETALLLPDAIGDALNANDRVKYVLTLLQTAKAHALDPDEPHGDLRAEREASGVADASFDAVVGGSRLTADGLLACPAAARLRDELQAGIDLMIRPLETTADRLASARAYRARLTTLIGALGSWSADTLPPGDVDAVTQTTGGVDSLHRLIIDLHRELNALQCTIARESIDGARTYRLAAADRPLVHAFMQGVNQTATLKMDHPGLGTTATRVGERVSIQNDLGTTETHVIVISVRGLTATLNYTDVHRGRERFLRSLLAPWEVEWRSAVPPTTADYEMSIGTFTAPDAEALLRYLRHLGSRLVFLIDWNKARKSLAHFMSKADAVLVLKWAADNNVGHRAFLEAGEQALRTALDRGAHPQLKYGLRLDEVLGADTVRAFFQAVLRLTSEGLRLGRTRQLIADEIEAELLSHLQTTTRATLMLAADHAALIAAIADRIRRVLLRAASGRGRAEAARAAALAKAWETKADALVHRARGTFQRPEDVALARLLAEADGAADALEQAAFLLTIAADSSALETAAALEPLADAVCGGAREYVRCLEYARDLPDRVATARVDEVLVSVDRLLQVEHDCDAIERAAEARLVRECADFRQLHVLSRVAQALESAVDALRHCSLIVRDFTLRSPAVPS